MSSEAMRGTEQGGFTLVELLIASTMIAVLFVGLGMHLRGGLLVWQRATQTAEAIQRRQAALDQLERDLADALVFDNREASYGSQPGQLPMPQFEHQRLRWFTMASSAKRGSGAVRLVTYECKQVGEQLGLWRTSQSIGEARFNAGDATPQLILPGCSELSLRYAYLPADSLKPLEWSETWEDDAYKELPRLLSASLRITPSGTNSDRAATSTAQPLQVQCMLSIPVGVLKQKTATP